MFSKFFEIFLKFFLAKMLTYLIFHDERNVKNIDALYTESALNEILKLLEVATNLFAFAPPRAPKIKIIVTKFA